MHKPAELADAWILILRARHTHIQAYKPLQKRILTGTPFIIVIVLSQLDACRNQRFRNQLRCGFSFPSNCNLRRGRFIQGPKEQVGQWPRDAIVDPTLGMVQPMPSPARNHHRYRIKRLEQYLRNTTPEGHKHRESACEGAREMREWRGLE